MEASCQWTALFGALEAAGSATVGYQVVQSENDADHAKASRRACNFDLILALALALALVVADDRPLDRFVPPSALGGSEE